MDGSTIRGNSTSVFDGDVIETTGGASRCVELNGARITLSPQSRAQGSFETASILENGTGLVRDAGKHVIEVATLRILLPASKDSVLQIETSGPTKMLRYSASSWLGRRAELRRRVGRQRCGNRYDIGV